MKAAGGHPRVPPLQAGIAASHFAEVETEAQGEEMPSKAGSLGTGPMPELTLILPTLAAIPSSSPFLSQAMGVPVLKTEDLASSSSQEPGLWSHRAWVQILSLTLNSCVTLGMSHSLSVPHFLICKMGIMTILTFKL